MLSLRTVHLVFILIAIIGAEMFGAWAIYHHPGLDSPMMWLGIATLLGGLGLCWYAYSFVRKMDQADIH